MFLFSRRFVLQPIDRVKTDLEEKVKNNEEKIKTIEVKYSSESPYSSPPCTLFCPSFIQQAIKSRDFLAFSDPGSFKLEVLLTVMDNSSALASKNIHVYVWSVLHVLGQFSHAGYLEYGHSVTYCNEDTSNVIISPLFLQSNKGYMEKSLKESEANIREMVMSRQKTK